jgi:hypothetical protein
MDNNGPRGPPQLNTVDVWSNQILGTIDFLERKNRGLANKIWGKIWKITIEIVLYILYI